MSQLKDVFNPASQNPIQRVGYFTSLAIAAAILFLHFPFEGYDIQKWVDTRPIGAPSACAPSSFYNPLNKCWQDGELQIRPFSEWESAAPILGWFGSVVHTLITLIFTLSVGGLWLWVFRTHDG